MGPQNAVMGDDAFGTELPQTDRHDEDLAEMQSAAKFSKTKEFKLLKEHLQGRMEFYQKYLPGGQSVVDVDPKVAGAMWIAANAIIGECKAIIDAYEQAAQVVKEQAKANAATR